MPFVEAQVAEPLKRARQTNLVVVAPGDGQRADIECARSLELAQGARGIAQVQQRDPLAARILKLLLQRERLLVRCLRLLIVAGSLMDRADPL